MNPFEIIGYGVVAVYLVGMMLIAIKGAVR